MRWLKSSVFSDCLKLSAVVRQKIILAAMMSTTHLRIVVYCHRLFTLATVHNWVCVFSQSAVSCCSSVARRRCRCDTKTNSEEKSTATSTSHTTTGLSAVLVLLTKHDYNYNYNSHLVYADIHRVSKKLCKFVFVRTSSYIQQFW